MSKVIQLGCLFSSVASVVVVDAAVLLRLHDVTRLGELCHEWVEDRGWVRWGVGEGGMRPAGTTSRGLARQGPAARSRLAALSRQHPPPPASTQPGSMCSPPRKTPASYTTPGTVRMSPRYPPTPQAVPTTLPYPAAHTKDTDPHRPTYPRPTPTPIPIALSTIRTHSTTSIMTHTHQPTHDPIPHNL